MSCCGFWRYGCGLTAEAEGDCEQLTVVDKLQVARRQLQALLDRAQVESRAGTVAVAGCACIFQEGIVWQFLENSKPSDKCRKLAGLSWSGPKRYCSDWPQVVAFGGTLNVMLAAWTHNTRLCSHLLRCFDWLSWILLWAPRGSTTRPQCNKLEVS